MTAVEDVPISAAGNPIGFGSMQRKEDPRFVRGQGNYVDDVNLPGMLHGAILRSPFAHARIISIDTSAAEALPSVDAVITGKTLEGIPRRRCSATTSRGCRRCRTTSRPSWPPTRCASRARRSRSSSPRTATSRRTRSSSSTSTTTPLPPVDGRQEGARRRRPGHPRRQGPDRQPHLRLHGNQTWESGNGGHRGGVRRGGRSTRRRRGGHPLPARAPGADGDLRRGRRPRQGHRPADAVHDQPGAARAPHGLRDGGRPARAQDPDHLARTSAAASATRSASTPATSARSSARSSPASR